MKEELKKDLLNMEEILAKTAGRVDIWQDRFIHAMAKAIYHLLVVTIKRMEG